MVNVNKDNFLEESDKLLKQLKNAKFCALDLEMTGIRDSSDCPTKKPSKCDTPEERYEKIRSVPESYGIIQIGVSLFLEDEGNPHNDLVAYNYNFYLFPSIGGSSFDGKKSKASRSCTKDIAISPSSFHFLAQHKMDFNHWINKGIPYVTVEEESHLLEQFSKRHQELDEKRKTITSSGKDRKSLFEPTEPNAIRFIARTMASLREWIDAAAPIQEQIDDDGDTESNNNHSLILPPCNGFFRKCLYENIEFEYPSLILEKVESPEKNSYPHRESQIRVLRLDPTERKIRLKHKKKLEWERLQKEEIGWTRIFRALSQANHGNHQNDNTKRQVPIIVHNGLMDLMFLLTHFHSNSLPKDYNELKSTIRNYFPLLYDSKVIATDHFDFSQVHNNHNSNPSPYDNSTVLGDLFNNFCVMNMNDTTHDSSTVVHNNINNNSGDNLSDEISIKKVNIPIIEEEDFPTEHLGTYIRSTQHKLHEAAYDAYMTGCVFYALCYHITTKKVYNQVEIENQSSCCCCSFLEFNNSLRRTLFGCNKIYLMQTLYTMDLETIKQGTHGEKEQEDKLLLPQDPLNKQLSYTTTYCVSGINFPIHTRDIARVLMNVIDSGSADEAAEENSVRRVSFEIIWVDDTTVLVATRCPPHKRDLLQRHGVLLLSALKQRFSHQSITSLQDFLSQKKRKNRKRKCPNQPSIEF